MKKIIHEQIEARNEEKRKLTTSEAAAFLRISSGTLVNWRYRVTGPAFSKTGGLIFYFKQYLENFERRIAR